MSKTHEVKTEAVTPAQANAQVAAAVAPAVASTLQGFTPSEMIEMAGAVTGLTAELSADAAPAPVTAAEANVTNEIADAGPAFGTFLSKVGMAVADTQKQLDLSMAEVAEKLSATTVKVASVFEQVITDEGKLGEGVVHMQEVPLVTLVTPTALQFTQVHISADMEVSEFTNAKGLTIKKSHTDFNANAKAKYSVFGGFGASGGTNFNTSSDGYSQNNSDASDKAAGKLHMEATIEPRAIPIPQPFVVQKGPKLTLSLVDRKDLNAGGTDETDPAKVTTRVVTVKAALVNTAGAPMSGKLVVSCDGGYPFTVGNSGTTDAATGELTITIRRGGITKETVGLVDTGVRASMGLVTAGLQLGI